MKWFEFAIRERGMTLREVSRQSGLNEPLLTNIKNGRVVPRDHEVKRIAVVLGLPADLLMQNIPVSLPSEPEDVADTVAGGVR